MAKGLAPVFFTACGVVVAGVAGYAVFESQSSSDKHVSAVSETSNAAKSTKEEKEQEIAKLDDAEDDTSSNSAIESDPAAKDEAPVAPIEVAPVKPSFGLVRVERDGSAVIAGEGPANELVQLIEGAKVLSETTVSAAGEFVFVLDEPLTPGGHELFLRVIPKEGPQSLSSSFAFVDVPKPKTIGEVTVLLAEAGKPSQILQKPEAVSGSDQTGSETKIVTATAQSKITLAKPELKIEEKAAIKKTEVSSLAPVLIEAADVENGKIFIAGSAEPLTSVNIYLKNELLGTAQVADNGAFLFEGSSELEPGRYDIRADMTKGGASVLARAEVTLVHEPEVVADIPKAEPKEEVASVETQEQPAEEEPVNLVEETTIENKAEQAEASTKPDVLESEEPSKQDKKEIQSGTAVIIRRGDSLWTVARRNYGTGIRYTTIFEANRDQVRDPHRIYPGQVLKVPESEQEIQ